MVVSPSLDAHFMELLGAVVEAYQQVHTVTTATVENPRGWVQRMHFMSNGHAVKDIVH